MSNDELNLYTKQFNDAVLDAYNKEVVPLNAVITKVNQKADRQLFDTITGVSEGNILVRNGSTKLDSKATGDFYNTRYSDVSAERVANYLENRYWATLITEYDKVRMVSDPTSIYVKAALHHMKKEQQKIIFNAISGSRKIVTINAQGISAETEEKFLESNVVIEKNLLSALKAAKTKFDSQNIHEEDRYFICSAETRNALLDHVGASATPLYGSLLSISSNNSNIKNILGYNVIVYEDSTYKNISIGNKKIDCLGFLVQKEAIKVGINSEALKARIEALPHKNYATQIYINFCLGGSRVNNKGVIAIAKDEKKDEKKEE